MTSLYTEAGGRINLDELFERLPIIGILEDLETRSSRSRRKPRRITRRNSWMDVSWDAR